MQTKAHPPMNIAVIGTGIAGMAAAWLLSNRHNVTAYEKDDRPGYNVASCFAAIERKHS